MVRFETRILIQRPIAEVFEFTTRFENIPEWVPGIPGARQTSKGPLGVGTIGREEFGHFPLRQIAKNWEIVAMTLILGRFTADLRTYRRWEITEYELNQKCVFRDHTWRLSSIVSFHFKPVEGRTEIWCLDEHQLHGLFALGEPVMARRFPKGREFLLGNLKRILETGSQYKAPEPEQA